MDFLSLSEGKEFDLNTEFFDVSYVSELQSYKVGLIRVQSSSLERNRTVSQAFGHWLAHHGWIGLVGVESFVDYNSATSFGFNEVRVQFISGEFQSNESRNFYAEVPHDVKDLIEELEAWLTQVKESGVQKAEGGGAADASDAAS